MKPLTKSALEVASDRIAEFFQQSQGNWHSERRYYTLASGEIQELESTIAIRYLAAGSPELLHLARLHQLPETTMLLCGAEVTWQSRDSVSKHKKSAGSTIFGARGTLLYRDRGFATTKPVVAEFSFPQPNILYLKTQYNDSSFEEEIKQISYKYRTRQTIIARAGEEHTIGQYLEKRLA